MAGVTPQLGLLPYQQDAWKLATDLSRDVVEGDVLMRHATEVDAATLSTGPTADFLGVVGAEYGGTASGNTTDPVGLDSIPYAALWGRNVKTRIQDSATVAYGAKLAMSSTTAGALRTALDGERLVGICKKAISSGAVNQFTLVDVFPAGAGGSAGNGYALVGEITDVSTAGSYWVVAPEGGTISKIYTVLHGAITGANSALSFELAGVAVTNGGITVTQSGSAAGDVDTATPTALNTVTAGQAIEMITDGGSTGTVAVTVTFLIKR